MKIKFIVVEFVISERKGNHFVADSLEEQQ